MQEKIVKKAKALCEKFINKVETGKARSHETYAECKALLKTINENDGDDINFKKSSIPGDEETFNNSTE